MSDHLSWIILPAALLNSAGGFLRFYAGKSYAIALTGQGLASLAQGCILQLPAGKAWLRNELFEDIRSYF